MIIYFDTYSILKTFFAWRKIRKANQIYFHSPVTFGFRKVFAFKGIVCCVVNFLNPKVEIKTYPIEEAAQIGFSVNRRAAGIVENMTGWLKSRPSFRTIAALCGDKNIIKAYKSEMVVEVADYLVFIEIARRLSLRADKVILYSSSAFKKWVPLDIQTNVSLCTFSSNAILIVSEYIYLFAFINWPILFIFRRARHFLLKTPSILRKHFSVLSPVMFGLTSPHPEIDGVKKAYSDDYLYCDEIQHGQIIHVFSKWRYPQYEFAMKDDMKSKGIPFVDVNELSFNSAFLLRAFRLQLLLWSRCVILLPMILGRKDVGRHSFYVLYCLLESYFEILNISFTVKILRDDYSPHHITDSIVCNELGRKTLGFQHGATAGMDAVPRLNYVHMDRYCVAGPKHIKMFSPFWKELNLVKTGSLTVEYVSALSKDIRRIQLAKNKIVDLYGRRDYNVLITFPSSAERNKITQWDQMFDALCDFEKSDINANIFFRFRSIEDFRNSHIKRFKKFLDEDSRFILDHQNFDTYTLMHVCDLVISNSVSTSIIESVVAGTKCFTFDYLGCTELCFSEYGKELVLATSHEVLKVLKALKNNHEDYVCDWNRLLMDYDFFSDDKSRIRIQAAVLQLLREGA